MSWGGPGEDGVYNMRQTADGGYILAGNSEGSGSSRDLAIWKLTEALTFDSEFGDSGWVKLGGSADDQAADVIEVLNAGGQPDGYLVVGYAESTDCDFAGLAHRGKIDTVLVRLNADGTLRASFGKGGIRLYGTSGDDEPIVHRHNYSEPGLRIVQASDGFIVATHARASDGDLEGIVVSGRALGRDVFIFKVDERGEFVESWADRGRFVLGAERGTQDRQENPNDFIFGIRLLEDGGLVGCGYTLGKSIVLDGVEIPTRGSGDEQGAANAFGKTELYKMDGMLIRLTPDGRLDPRFGKHGVAFLGGTGQEKMYDVEPDGRGGYLAVGRTASQDLDMERPSTSGGSDGMDMFLARLDGRGRLDPTFGQGGVVIFSESGDNQGLRATARSDASVLWMGQSDSCGGRFELPGRPELFRQAILAVLESNGTTRQIYSFGAEGEEKPCAFLVDREGRVHIAGFSIAGIRDNYSKDSPFNRERQAWLVRAKID
jgi:uncharacterized delta-60 repeat protein